MSNILQQTVTSAPPPPQMSEEMCHNNSNDKHTFVMTFVIHYQAS